MKFSDYLFDDGEDYENPYDLTSKLLLMDSALMQIHASGRYVSSSLLDARIIDNKIDPSSIQIDIFDAEKNENDYAQDIVELCAIGICAYNRMGENEGYPKYFTSADFIHGLSENIEPFLAREDIPEDVKNYYRTIFTLLDIKYMNNYLEEVKKNDGGKGSSKQLIYSTPEGRAFVNNNEGNSAFAFIIAIPITLVVSYVLTMIIILIIKML